MLTIKEHDFTVHRFRQLCETISSTYPTVTITEYLNNKHPERFILMRHDVDRMPGHSLTTAKIEQELGIRATYYFRSIKSVFKPNIIRKIRDMGHEIGYHYETLSETDGNPKEAIDLFRSRLDDFRKICEVRTVSMHGKPLSKYNNLDLWNTHDFRDFEIIGEAYLSAGDDLNYLSDTGRTWSFENNIRDYIPGKNEQVFANTTEDLIELIKKGEYNNFYILTHPERWSSSIAGWGLYYSADLAVNIGKKILMKRNSESQRMRGIRNNKFSATVEIEDWHYIPSVSGYAFSSYKNVNELFENSIS